jgi:hypothetical protein
VPARNQQLLEADEGADSSESDSYATDEEDVERALGMDADATRTDVLTARTATVTGSGTKILFMSFVWSKLLCIPNTAAVFRS